MKYQDRIYGSVEIKEPVILELIACPAIQRLKEIDCAGYMRAHFPDIERSRFEHSMGVFLLLRKYNASLEEQIAGLIHDVSHSAFSHCVDYALAAGSQKEQNHQDNVFDAFVRQTEIPV
ncbi:MAG: HD domain-containing protein [Parcubacteria group bacterium]|nr:HD domain-containing protein [Parcubacteria group bacterium]